MAESLYHSSSGRQCPHCVHVVGVGRTGAGYVDALLRTGDVEDLLEDPRARFAVLIVDIGKQDMLKALDYAAGFRDRLRSRNIPVERFHFEAVPLQVPSRDDLFQTLRRYREFLKLECPRYYWNPNYEPWLPGDFPLPGPGEHFPRAVAKAIYGRAYYDGDRPLNGALARFTQQVENCRLPSIVLMCFGLGGGTGSGMVVDLARHLSNVKLGYRIPVIGLGQLPNSGDSEMYRGASLFPILNEIDCMVDDEKNRGVMTVWGDLYRNPFNGGFLVVAAESAYQRLRCYIETELPEARKRRQLGGAQVTNKFIQDAVMRFVARDQGRALYRALKPGSFVNPLYPSGKSRNFILYNIAKLAHPGVQVLPGEPLSKWYQVLDQWIGRISDYSPVNKEFRTDFAELHLYAPRKIGHDHLERKLREKITEFLLPGEDSAVHLENFESFDEFTSYADIILPNMAKTDLNIFWASRDQYDKQTWEQKLLDHSWLLELGVMLSESALGSQGMAGECIWGCGCHVNVPFDQMRGDKLPPPTCKEIFEQSLAPVLPMVLPTP